MSDDRDSLRELARLLREASVQLDELARVASPLEATTICDALEAPSHEFGVALDSLPATLLPALLLRVHSPASLLS